MRSKAIVERLSRMVHIPSKGRNSFLASIEDAEVQQNQKASHPETVAPLRLFHPDANEESPRSAASATTDGDTKANLSVYTPGIDPSESQHPTDVPLDLLPAIDPCVLQSIAKDIDRSVSYTLGLVTVASEPLPREVVEQFTCDLADLAQRITYCIHANQRPLSVSSKPASSSSTIHAFFESWNLEESSGKGSLLQARTRTLPHLKGHYPLIVLDLGSIHHSWVEPLGRLCDSVHLVLPSYGTLHPCVATSQAQKLLKAQVPVKATWVARVA